MESSGLKKSKENKLLYKFTVYCYFLFVLLALVSLPNMSTWVHVVFVVVFYGGAFSNVDCGEAMTSIVEKCIANKFLCKQALRYCLV